jgi:hypothetical protein
MDAIEFNNPTVITEFNRAIQKVMELGHAQLHRFGFSLDAVPEPQEDSGDWVASESISLIFSHRERPVQMRFFLCCGKGDIADSLSASLVSRTFSHIVVDLSALSQKLGRQLHTMDFNWPKQPMSIFLESYFAEFGADFETYLNTGLMELEARETAAGQLADFGFTLP